MRNIPWLTAANVIGGPVEEKDILFVQAGPVGPVRPLTLEIDQLKQRLARETDPGAILLLRERVQLLEQLREAEQIAGRNIAAQLAEREAAERKRNERRVERARLGLSIADVKRGLEDVKKCRQECTDEERRIAAKFEDLEARMAAVRRQAEEERPDLMGLLHETAEVQALRIERQALERRAVQIFVEQNHLREKEMQLCELLEGDADEKGG